MTEPAAAAPPPVHALVAEAMRKAALAWLEVPGERPRAAWIIWHEDALYVVHGGGEQPLPGLADASSCQVTIRSGDNAARIVGWPAVVTRVEPGSEEWATVVPLLLGKRLNLPEPNTAEERWASGSTVSRLAPDGQPDAALPDGSLAEPPAPSPATTQATVPFTLHRKPRRTPGRTR